MDIPSLNPDLGQGQGQGRQSNVAGARTALPDQARASTDLTLLEDFQAKGEQDENGEISEVVEETAVLHHLALYRKEIAKSLKLAVPHNGLCPSHEDFERIALTVLHRPGK
ncbi:TPA: hypothetical protein ACH3X2_002544 [Trebouxia sp. C0005]